VLTTLELVKAQGLASTKPLPNPTSFESPTGYADLALSPITPLEDLFAPRWAPRAPPTAQRWAAAADCCKR
jgi:hypothetical protein